MLTARAVVLLVLVDNFKVLYRGLVFLTLPELATVLGADFILGEVRS